MEFLRWCVCVGTRGPSALYPQGDTGRQEYPQTRNQALTRHWIHKTHPNFISRAAGGLRVWLGFKAPADGLCDAAVWTEGNVRTWRCVSTFVAAESGVFHAQTTACSFSVGYSAGTWGSVLTF